MIQVNGPYHDNHDTDKSPVLSSNMGMAPLTINTNQGRLGNQMFTFATLYGLGRLNHRGVALMPHNQKVISQYFDISSFPVVKEDLFVPQRPWQIGNWLKKEDSSIPLLSNIIVGNIYPTSFTFFDHVRKEIREIFRFSDKVKNGAQNFLRHVKKIRPWTEVFVGVHVRRGDYTSHKQGVSDDREWCRTNLSEFDILTTPDSPGPAEDLALLAECNHTIMTYGTYGFWGGYLSGGEVVYFTDFLKPNTDMTKTYFKYEKMYPPEWVGISTTKPGFWETYKNPYMD
ncbi:galactoside alpha-(1,2)-fucosyltransferase 1 [Caerostris extrusa]|uniref:L-Fucosyltransferase n=1 Tax=Caerostris extrusa TaxID=172846 RepID=A0AAV4NJV3_CAEEX|nr:galactoside alpha-(1,2)-fucosyltransferase 1 [Caerostris extrusa]